MIFVNTKDKQTDFEKTKSLVPILGKLKKLEDIAPKTALQITEIVPAGPGTSFTTLRLSDGEFWVSFSLNKGDNNLEKNSPNIVK